MESKKFSKNDSGFTCQHCGNIVQPLHHSSRDHCNKCLHSIHVDVNPGDRANECKGLLVPIDIEQNKKGRIIVYKCQTCGQLHKNIDADDDNFDAIIKIIEDKVKNS